MDHNVWEGDCACADKGAVSEALHIIWEPLVLPPGPDSQPPGCERRGEDPRYLHEARAFSNFNTPLRVLCKEQPQQAKKEKVLIRPHI